MGYNGSGSDYGIFPYRDAHQYRHVTADPYAVADGDRFGNGQHLTPTGSLHRMRHGKDAGIGAYPHVIADGNGGHVEEHHIVIGEEIVTDMDIDTQIAFETGFDARIFSDASEQFTKQLFTNRVVENGYRVYFLTQGYGPVLDFGNFRVIHLIICACTQFFYLFHNRLPLLSFQPIIICREQRRSGYIGELLNIRILLPQKFVSTRTESPYSAMAIANVEYEHFPRIVYSPHTIRLHARQ